MENIERIIIMWNSIKNFFKDSETIFWARLQMAVGAIWTVLVASDLSPLLNPKWMTYWLIFSGVITEMARRSRATDL